MITIISTSTAIQEVAAISMFSNFLLITKLLDNNFVCLHTHTVYTYIQISTAVDQETCIW